MGVNRSELFRKEVGRFIASEVGGSERQRDRQAVLDVLFIEDPR